MIIDIHAHLHVEGMPPRAYVERFVKYLAGVSRKSEEESGDWYRHIMTRPVRN